MFVCPRCGYRDAACWKAHRYFLYVVYCRLDELDTFEKELADRLRLERQLEVGPYFYKLGKTGYVLRAPKELKQFIFERRLIERYKQGRDTKQQKLV